MLNKEEVYRELRDQWRRSEDRYEELERKFAEGGFSSVELDELRNLQFCIIDLRKRLFTSLIRILDQNDAQIKDEIAKLQKDLEVIESNKKALDNAVKAVELASEVVKVVTAIAQKIGAGV